MQVGMGVFLVAIPLDLINHRIQRTGHHHLERHARAALPGTAVMMTGVIQAGRLYGPPGRARWLTLGTLWVFFLENVMFGPASRSTAWSP